MAKSQEPNGKPSEENAAASPPPPPPAGAVPKSGDDADGLTLEDDSGKKPVVSKGTPGPQSEWKKTAGAMTSELGDWQLFLRRSLRSDFYRERATETERMRLSSAATPIESELAQDYAAWRRGMLWFTLFAMSIALIFSLIETIDALGERDLADVVKFVLFLFFAFQATATVLVGMAAMQWTNLSKSRKLTRFAWLALFVGPIAMLFIPWASMMDDVSQQEILQAAAVMAAIAAIQLMPKIMGLFAGLVRASLTLKTMLPESTAPGWMAIFVTPFYILFLAIPLTITIQTTYGVLLIIALLCFMTAPIVLLIKTKELLQPMAPEKGHKLVRTIRLTSIGCTLVGGVFFVIFLGDTIKGITFWNALSAVAGFATSVLLLALVMSDVMLGLMCRSFASGQQFHGTEVEKTLAGKFADLSAGGLAEIDMGEGAVLKKLGGAANFAGWVGKEMAASQSKTSDEASPKASADNDKAT